MYLQVCCHTGCVTDVSGFFTCGLNGLKREISCLPRLFVISMAPFTMPYLFGVTQGFVGSPKENLHGWLEKVFTKGRCCSSRPSSSVSQSTEATRCTCPLILFISWSTNFVRSFHQGRRLTVGCLSTCLQLPPALRPRHGPVRNSPLTLRLVLYIYRA